ncbi:uncharacterized protein EDB93DRAFT_1105144 [Suillus bovinus]|uniref:uncharacterized protein n=1 Tax=Suillus bovinus TaxID=48563 RepID=UPI001B8788D1|nr:uncharacterized protein EDB93DRAFT_1105144 [Suillus bovinus]KAG2143816.1 hypothetical protein EDB93DRAFT_1105144 [Suillus bovinus]
MDNSPLPPRPIHIDSKMQKGQRVGDKVPVDDTNKARAPAVPRGKFKEKFQVLRERFDQVVGEREVLERDLELANARMRKLQAENDLLLDAINLTVPATPSLMHLTRPSPTIYPHPAAPPMALPPSHHMNGHSVSVSHVNGRYRPVDPRDITPSERGRDYRDIPPETTGNGRL